MIIYSINGSIGRLRSHWLRQSELEIRWLQMGLGFIPRFVSDATGIRCPRRYIAAFSICFRVLKHGKAEGPAAGVDRDRQEEKTRGVNCKGKHGRLHACRCEVHVLR